MKYFLLLIIAALTTCLTSFAQDTKNDIKIKHADSLEADNEQIAIKGNVVINYNDAVIEAPEAKIEIDNITIAPAGVISNM